MPAINFNSTLLRLIKDVNDIRAALRRVAVDLPLFDIANENTPAQITADQNNYVPGNYDILRLFSDQDVHTITGFRGGIRGRSLRLFNVGDYEIVLAHQNAGSDAANRIISTTGFDIVLNAGGEIVLYYDETQNRWRASYNSNAQRHYVELQLSGAQSISDAAYEQISWTSEIADTNDFFSPLTPTYITIPETGWYQTTLHMVFDINSTNLRETMLEKSTTSPYGNISFDSRLAVANASTNVELARLVYLERGELIYATVWQNSGGPLNVNVDGPRDSFTTLIVTKM